MTLGSLRTGLQHGLRRRAGRWLACLLVLVVVTTGFPRLEAHAHAHGEPSHATIIHVGATTGHDHHAGHGHALHEPHDAHVHPDAPDAPSAPDLLQHLHLLPHVLALPASVSALPAVRPAPAATGHPAILAAVSRPEELFRPPIR